MSEPKEPIFYERQYITDATPRTDRGGYLEYKHGEICLRRGDSLRLIAKDVYLLERSWLRPLERPFDPNLYDFPAAQ